MSEDLKPCPFCGNEGKVKYEHFFSIEDCEVDNVMCEKCGIYFETYTRDDVSADVLWNRRPAEDALNAENERLKNKLALMKEHLIVHRDSALNNIREDKDQFRKVQNEFLAWFCNRLIELINANTGKGGENE